MIKMATKKGITNCPILSRDIRIAKDILGPSVHGLRGKRTHRKTDALVINDSVPLPKTIEERYSNVVLAADVLHVNRTPMLATISRIIHYATVCA